jgi:hypothetical protein
MAGRGIAHHAIARLASKTPAHIAARLIAVPTVVEKRQKSSEKR